MSTNDRAPAFGEQLADLPAFEMSYAFDDTDDPTRITVYADTGQKITQWISIDIEYAVDLDEVA